jgi:hypothetical protein
VVQEVAGRGVILKYVEGEGGGLTVALPPAPSQLAPLRWEGERS